MPSTLEFLCEPQSPAYTVPAPCASRRQISGVVQALEIDAPDGQFIRLAFRATALPEQLDGLAPGELTADPIPAECSATAVPATHPSVRNES